MPRNLRRFSHATPFLAASLLLVLMSLPSASNHFFNLLRPKANAATSFAVNSTGDSADSNPGDGICNDGNGVCTLRAAIQEANAVAGDDVITFAATLSGGVITLNNVLPDISGNLTITGPASTLVTVQRSTVAGTPNFRIFTINSGKTVIISDLTISNGNLTGANGGGILNNGSLTLIRCNLYGNRTANSGGAIYNDGPSLTINDSKIGGTVGGQPNTGVGIFHNGGSGVLPNNGTLLMTGGSISGNTAGGISLIAPATLNGVSITNNVGGGGMFISGSSQNVTSIINCLIANNNNSSTGGFGGGGVNNQSFGTVTAVNTTISGNSTSGSGGGIRNFNADLTLTNVTITNNRAGRGGGIDLSGSVVLKNTIVARNFRGASPSTTPDDISDIVAASSSFNLIGTGGSGGLTSGVNGNLVGVSDPLLGPLAANGGTTFTHALLLGSPAIDAGNSTQPTDQRGQPRPVDDITAANAAGSNASDIGAYEAHTLQVNSTADASDGTCTVAAVGNGCTLREAVIAANAEAGAELITFAPALTAGGPTTITLLTALADLSSDMTIAGPGANLLTVERSHVGGTPEFRVFMINFGRVVTMSGLTVSNGSVSSPNSTVPGGGISNAGMLTLTDSTVSGNNATAPGGGIQNSGMITVNNCIVSANSGGGIANNIFGGSPTATINNSVISGNTINGGIYNNALNGTANLTINNSTISGNSSTSVAGGGGIFLGSGSFTSRATMTINNSTISGNNASVGRGGGIYSAAVFGNALTTLTITNTTISGNTCSGDGGGILHFSSGSGSAATGTITNSTITANNANGGNGGGISTSSGSSITTLTLRNTIAAGNFQSSGTMASAIDGAVDLVSSFNLIGTGGSGGLVNGVNANQVGVANSLLGPLANNGGPTLTHALLPGSSALDAGSDANLPSDTLDLDGDGDTAEAIPFDQRGAGLNRIVDAADIDSTATVDVGAFEAQVSLEDIPDKTANEDTQLQFSFNVGGLITNVTGSSSNTLLLPNNAANIVVSGSGSKRTLTINPAADQFGSSTITVTVIGNNNQSMTDTFLLTVNPVNDAPSFMKGPDQTVNNNAGVQTVGIWATNISPGPPNESGQTLNFLVTGNSNPSLFALGPLISSAGVLTYQPASNAGGTATITIVLQDSGGTANGGQDTSPSQSFNITVVPAGGFLKLSSASSITTESSGFTTTTVMRTGSTALPVKVNYATSDDSGLPCSTATGLASPKCDFTTAAGTLSFAAGENTKTIIILISQDSYIEGPEDLTLTLSNPTGFAALASPSTVTVTITDDATEPALNPVDDPDIFVRQHYHDFLNREPDASGLAFWTNQITECQQPGASCNAEVRRINVSAAFFLSIEFQETGYLVERLYKTAYGDAISASTFGGAHQLPVPIIRFGEFLPDTQEIGRGVVVGQPGWEQAIENNKQAFIAEFVQRLRFTNAYQTTMTPAQFVDGLYLNAGVSSPPANERTAAIDEFAGASTSTDLAARARALRRVAENSTLAQQESNRAFVLMQYFGYLRRNPNDAPDSDYSGYDFWLTKLNQFGGNFINAEMVKAFIVSGEYRQRFGL